ncbi:sulfurtransferase TusA family protein [Geobacter hydrogenophilus]|uniref:tRNA methyltransferase n=1 Tax=Geobacter hydrogenophilus TaxID=40983 RepID=A0A9W6LCI3_9BACT|nr:sulfurtransferase TusA family protein [Geobacter hydrogenophilus]MBT0893370.1 sulfurtransferase TusA family protein [Geobacter hydrogenophilus]GLI37935.1 tRNA methyltransferase [Geobacter hydrogenophilus]
MTSAAVDTIEYDIRGQICPSTLLIALREINSHAPALRNGAVALLFLTTNRASTHTIPESAHNMGFYAEVTQHDGYYAIKVSGND